MPTAQEKSTIYVEQRQSRPQNLSPQSNAIIVSMEAAPPQQAPVLPPKPPQKSHADQLEFDLPPPPPSQFLPENELDKIKIAELIAQQHHHQSGQVRPKTLNRIQQIQQQQVKLIF